MTALAIAFTILGTWHGTLHQSGFKPFTVTATIRGALEAASVAGARELAHEHVMHSFELLTTILDHVGADWAACASS